MGEYFDNPMNTEEADSYFDTDEEEHLVSSDAEEGSGDE